MKIIYITSIFFSSIIYAQEINQAPIPAEDQTLPLKQAKELQEKALKETRDNTEKKTTPTTLVSDQGLEVKKQELNPKASKDHSGNLLPNTATLEEIKKTIPNRQAHRHTDNSRNTNTNVTGLPNTATLEEIKKTIPKN